MTATAATRRANLRCALGLGLLFAAGPALAADVVGVVTRDGKPLPGAEVVLSADGKGFTARSDQDGRFLIRNIRPGSYQLNCGKDTATVSVRDGLNQFNCNG
jgi:hypothetical protein